MFKSNRRTFFASGASLLLGAFIDPFHRRQEVEAQTCISATALAGQSNTRFDQASTQIIDKIISGCKRNDNIHTVLDSAVLDSVVADLACAAQADAVLLWGLVGDCFRITHAVGTSIKVQELVGSRLSARESISIDVELRTKFPNRSDSGMLSVHLPSRHSAWSQLLLTDKCDFLEILQLRADWRIHGFIQLLYKQQLNRTEAAIDNMVRVADLIGVLLEYESCISFNEQRYRQMALGRSILEFFYERQDLSDACQISLTLICNDAGFRHGQIYLYDPESKLLIGQCGDREALSMDQTDDPCVSTFINARRKVEPDRDVEYPLTWTPYASSSKPRVSTEKLGVLKLSTRTTTRRAAHLDEYMIICNAASSLASALHGRLRSLQERA